MGADRSTTYFTFINDIAAAAGIDRSRIFADGVEEGWPPRSDLCVDLSAQLGYPARAYQTVVDQIAQDIKR